MPPPRGKTVDTVAAAPKGAASTGIALVEGCGFASACGVGHKRRKGSQPRTMRAWRP